MVRQVFDAIIVASGHYHAPRIPDIPGLSEAKTHWASRIMHSKGFRKSQGFENKVRSLPFMNSHILTNSRMSSSLAVEYHPQILRRKLVPSPKLSTKAQGTATSIFPRACSLITG